MRSGSANSIEENCGESVACAAAAIIARALGDVLGRGCLPQHLDEQIDVRFVERRRHADLVAERARGALAEAREQIGAVRHFPPAAHGEPARHGEVVVGDDRQQAVRAAGGQHLCVMIELGLRELARLGLDPRPFDAEPIAVEPESTARWRSPAHSGDSCRRHRPTAPCRPSPADSRAASCRN